MEFRFSRHHAGVSDSGFAMPTKSTYTSSYGLVTPSAGRVLREPPTFDHDLDRATGEGWARTPGPGLRIRPDGLLDRTRDDSD
ncbi:hypothetical protein SUDANB95_03417 [Actinosynnema sp. ALI-1.44]